MLQSNLPTACHTHAFVYFIRVFQLLQSELLTAWHKQAFMCCVLVFQPYFVCIFVCLCAYECHSSLRQ